LFTFVKLAFVCFDSALVHSRFVYTSAAIASDAYLAVAIAKVFAIVKRSKAHMSYWHGVASLRFVMLPVLPVVVERPAQHANHAFQVAPALCHGIIWYYPSCHASLKPA
jgi:hypothetical protein